MGALNTKQQNWPDVITTLRCDRQRVYENILSTEACWDWFPEIKQVIPKRDGDVAPGMLCKTGFSDATDYIEMNDKAADKNGVGCYVEWTFYACGWGPAISENTHLWIKQNYDFKFKQQFFLTDCPGQPGSTVVVRKTTALDHRQKLWFPYWMIHTHVMIAPEQTRLKSAAESKWVSRPPPSKEAGKKWPMQALHAK
ncbi:hypothetical protein KFE25_011828 [Diacronema lutheri]|uniref:Uncharacterized protein n=2 Tax=Diacronema lutheri TaxID=2081491 RepID=A0A8J5XG79_DIALT|nr:hypothetical protein KFE25_011828 [Diacronema lutheri]